jgi:phosphoribosylglycinamide formyltransferase 1
MHKIAILASHNGSGFEAIYKAVLAKRLQLDIQVVISNNPDANVLHKASDFGIQTHIVNKSTDENPDKKIYDILKNTNCTHVFLSGYMKKLSPLLTQNFSIINSHPALLPKFGGAGMYGRNVHEAVIKAKEQESGVTIHEVNENYDEGKIIFQKALKISENETVDSLESKIKDLEKESIIQALELCLK